MNSSLFLSGEEVAVLTGYVRPSCQIRQLRDYGLRFFVAADGHPRVVRSDLEESRSVTKREEPNLAGLKSLGRE